MLFNKPLAEIKESDLQTLIDNKVSERKIIEYKRDLPGEKYKDRKEFLADVSSFANTAGGYLIYGIATKQGVPIELYGVEIASIDDFKLASWTFLWPQFRWAFPDGCAATTSGI